MVQKYKGWNAWQAASRRCAAGYWLSRRSSVCSRSSVLRTPSSAVRTAVAAAEAAVRGPVEDERSCALACG